MRAMTEQEVVERKTAYKRAQDRYNRKGDGPEGCALSDLRLFLEYRWRAAKHLLTYPEVYRRATGNRVHSTLQRPKAPFFRDVARRLSVKGRSKRTGPGLGTRLIDEETIPFFRILLEEGYEEEAAWVELLIDDPTETEPLVQAKIKKYEDRIVLLQNRAKNKKVDAQLSQQIEALHRAGSHYAASCGKMIEYIREHSPDNPIASNLSEQLRSDLSLLAAIAADLEERRSP